MKEFEHINIFIDLGGAEKSEPPRALHFWMFSHQLLKIVALGVGFFGEIFVDDYIETCQTSRRAHGMTAKCGDVSEWRRAEILHNIFVGDESPDWHTAAHSLGKIHDVGHNVKMLKTKHFASATKTHLHLVKNEQRASFCAFFSQCQHPFLVGNHKSALALNHFCNHAGSLFGDLIEVVHVVEKASEPETDDLSLDNPENDRYEYMAPDETINALEEMLGDYEQEVIKKNTTFVYVAITLVDAGALYNAVQELKYMKKLGGSRR